MYQKSVLYTLLVDLVPPTPLRARTLRSFADFLKNADRDRAGRTLWFAFANRLIELTRSADRALVLDLLEHSDTRCWRCTAASSERSGPVGVLPTSDF